MVDTIEGSNVVLFKLKYAPVINQFFADFIITISEQDRLKTGLTSLLDYYY